MKIAVVFEKNGTLRLVSDEPVQAYVVDEHTPDDRVYELKDSVECGEGLVDEVLGEDAVWLGAPEFVM